MENSEIKKGIGGWLFVVLIGMIGILIQTVNDLKDTIEGPYQSIIRKTFITYITGGYHSPYGVWLLFKITFNVIVIVFIVCLLILMLTKSRFFPKSTIVYLIVVSLLHVVRLILGYAILFNTPYYPSAYNFIATLFISALIIPYLLLSKRVKATFGTKKNAKKSDYERQEYF